MPHKALDPTCIEESVKDPRMASHRDSSHKWGWKVRASFLPTPIHIPPLPPPCTILDRACLLVSQRPTFPRTCARTLSVSSSASLSPFRPPAIGGADPHGKGHRVGSKGEMPGSGSPLDLHPGHSVDRTMAGAAEAMASSLVPPPRGLASYAIEYGVSGMSVGAATCCTNPLDVIKVRLQLADFMQRRGMLATASGIVQQEGFTALFKGLSAALMRAGVYGGARLGFYGPMKSLLSPGKDPTFGTKLLAGMASGAAAAAIANPTDLIKVRLQAQKTGGAGGITPQYNGAVGAITHIVRAEGVLGLWRGVQPSMMRSAILTATQAATYDEAKRHVLKITGMKEGVQTHLGCSLLTGLVTTTVINPVEVVKNTMFTKGKECNMGPVATAGNIFAREGMRGLYKGWTANYARLGPQTTITFLVLEKLRSIAGLGTV